MFLHYFSVIFFLLVLQKIVQRVRQKKKKQSNMSESPPQLLKHKTRSVKKTTSECGKIFGATTTPNNKHLMASTTWRAMSFNHLNMFGIAITALALLTIPWLRIWPITQKIAAFTIVPLAIAAVASIICTAIVSQMLLSFSVDVERPENEPEEDKKKSLCISIDFVKKMLSYNFVFHLGPLLFAVLLCLAVTFIPAPSTLLGRSAVFLISLCSFPSLRELLSTPTKVVGQLDSYDNDEGEDEKDEAVTGTKINRCIDPPLCTPQYVSCVVHSMALFVPMYLWRMHVHWVVGPRELRRAHERTKCSE